MKKIAYDCIALDQAQIVEDSKCCLKVNAIIARSGVYQYEDGKALKSKMELLKATRTARYAKLTVGNHPLTQVLMNQSDIKGGVEGPFFDNGKLRAVLNFDKEELPKETIDKIKSAIENKTGLDNSIGFYYQPDWTPGLDKNVNNDKEERYDYVMRDIVIDHVAVITDSFGGQLHGRCTFPKCGIGADCITCPRKIGKTFSCIPSQTEIKYDVIEKRGNKWCVLHCHGPEAGDPIQCFNTPEDAEAFHAKINKSSVSNIGGKNKMCEKETTETIPPEAIVTPPTPPKTAQAMPSVVEKTPMERCIASQVEQGKSEEEATAWCKAESAGEHASTDSLIASSNALLEMKRQRDIERQRDSRRHPV